MIKISHGFVGVFADSMVSPSQIISISQGNRTAALDLVQSSFRDLRNSTDCVIGYILDCMQYNEPVANKTEVVVVEEFVFECPNGTFAYNSFVIGNWTCVN